MSETEYRTIWPHSPQPSREEARMLTVSRLCTAPPVSLPCWRMYPAVCYICRAQ